MKEKKAEEKSLNKTVITPSSKHSRKSMPQRKYVKIKISKWVLFKQKQFTAKLK